MDRISSIYHFLFETYPGIACLIFGAFVITFIASFILERRTRKVFVDRDPEGVTDDWTFFEDDDEEEE